MMFNVDNLAYFYITGMVVVAALAALGFWARVEEEPGNRKKTAHRKKK